MKFRRNDLSISGVERQIDDFLKTHTEIDEVFVNVFNQRFETLLTYRLRGKNTVFHIFPEGVMIVSLQDTMRYAFQEYYTKEVSIKQFNDKYPLDFSRKQE